MNKLTWKYTLAQGAYWGGYCTLHAYAAVYLLDKGFSNGSIGILLALANVLAVFLQPLVGGILDSSKKYDVRGAMMFFSVLAIVLSAILYICGDSIWLIGVLFLASYMIQMVCQPLTSTLGYEFINRGYPLNFGLPRGIGSCTFAVVSVIMGNLIGNYGSKILPLGTIVLFALYMLSAYIMRIPKESIKKVEAVEQENTEEKELKSHSNFLEFVKYYPKVSMFLLAVVAVFIMHSIVNDFLIQIITPLGGDSTMLGYAISLAAVLELPAMACFSLLKKKFNCGTLLKFSLIFFTVKGVITLVAWNMVMIYVAQAFQAVAYAMFIPASIDYMNQKMEELDLVKGQAFVTGALTLGSVFGTVLGGQLLDITTPANVMIMGCIISAVGSLIGCLFVEKVVEIR